MNCVSRGSAVGWARDGFKQDMPCSERSSPRCGAKRRGNLGGAVGMKETSLLAPWSSHARATVVGLLSVAGTQVDLGNPELLSCCVAQLLEE